MLTEERKAVHRGRPNNTHSAHSAGRGQSHGTGQQELMVIGHWPPTRTTSALPAPSIAPETHITIRRTGADLRNEEEDVGTVRLRTHLNDSTQSENEAPGPSY